MKEVLAAFDFELVTIDPVDRARRNRINFP